MSLTTLRLEQITYAARDTHLFTFRGLEGQTLPRAEAGAHIDLHLAPGLIRQYSLIHPSDTPDSYVVGIKKDPSGRGGSRHAHDKLRVGDVLEVGGPRNHFTLVEDAPFSVLIAGGIGITPIFAMAQRLTRLGRPFALHVSNRCRADAALLAEIARLDGVQLHFDDEAGGRHLDLAAVVDAAPDGAHFYCCGPAPMLDAYRNACATHPVDHVHFEIFNAPPPALGATNGGAGSANFTVRLARSGRDIDIPADASILDSLRSQGIEAQSSCEAGICGMCETAVLQGEVEHHDHVLSPQDQASNTRMMICCSRAKSPLLVLDL